MKYSKRLSFKFLSLKRLIGRLKGKSKSSNLASMPHDLATMPAEMEPAKDERDGRTNDLSRNFPESLENDRDRQLYTIDEEEESSSEESFDACGEAAEEEAEEVIMSRETATLIHCTQPTKSSFKSERSFIMDSKSAHFGDSLGSFRYFSHNAPPIATILAREESIEEGWRIEMTNMRCLQEVKLVPVFLEKIYVSPDGSKLMGIVSVLNLGFEKLVVIRFTSSSWRDFSEAEAVYSDSLPRNPGDCGVDRFKFTIDLDTQEVERVLRLCVRYVVNGQVFWDNNQYDNYQFLLAKKQLDGGASRNNHHFPKESYYIPEDLQQEVDQPLRRKYSLANSLRQRYDLGASLFRASAHFLTGKPKVIEV